MVNEDRAKAFRKIALNEFREFSALLEAAANRDIVYTTQGVLNETRRLIKYLLGTRRRLKMRGDKHREVASEMCKLYNFYDRIVSAFESDYQNRVIVIPDAERSELLRIIDDNSSDMELSDVNKDLIATGMYFARDMRRRDEKVVVVSRDSGLLEALKRTRTNNRNNPLISQRCFGVYYK